MKNKSVFYLLIIVFLLFPVSLLAAGIIPNDPGYGQQWQLVNIHAPEVWGRSTGSVDVIVAIIDSGVDIDHPDLVSNIASGGWDFIANNNDPRPKLDNVNDLTTVPIAINHGTILAGIIGAIGNNNEGLTGVLWKTKILPIRAIKSDGSGQANIIAQAIDYAIDHHAKIINLSFVGDGNDELLSQAIERAGKADVLIVAAAGNEFVDQVSGEFHAIDLEKQPLFPVCNRTPDDVNTVLSVASVNKQDKKSVFSSYGKSCVNISAPGEEIIGTRASQPEFGAVRLYGGTFQGTSMSAAYVSGAAALLKSIHPKAPMMEIKKAIMEGADPIDAVNPEYAGKLGKGRLNIEKSLVILDRIDPLISGSIPVQSVDIKVIEPALIKPVVVNQVQPVKKIIEVKPPLLVSVKYSLSNKKYYTYSVMDREGEVVSSIFLPANWAKIPTLKVLSGGDFILVSPVGSVPTIAKFNKLSVKLTQWIPYADKFRNGLNVNYLNRKLIISLAGYNNEKIKIYNEDGKLLSVFSPKEKDYEVLVSAGFNNLALRFKKDAKNIYLYSLTGKFIKKVGVKDLNQFKNQVIIYQNNKYQVVDSLLSGQEYALTNTNTWKGLAQSALKKDNNQKFDLQLN